MSGIRLEAFLARLYSEPAARADFLRDRAAAARRAGLAAGDLIALLALDAGELALAAGSYERKRKPPPPRRSWFHRLMRRAP